MFQKLMETVLKEILWKICVVYIDDVICYANESQTACNNLNDLGLSLKPKKCRLFSCSPTFLGHVISGDGVAPDPETMVLSKIFKNSMPLIKLTQKGRIFD